MEQQGMDLIERGTAAAPLVPMLVFGCLYILVIAVFLWGFVAIVSAQGRMAAALEESNKLLRELVDRLQARG